MIKNLVSLIFTSAVFLSACLEQEETPIHDPSPVEAVIADQGREECMDAVKVIVWSDINAVGTHDIDEPPLEGALVMLVPRDDPTSGGIDGTTFSTGIIHFPTREMQDCNPHLYQAIFPVEFAGHQFPLNPVAYLKDFDPDTDTVEFGLLPNTDDSVDTPPIDFTGCDVFSEAEIVEFIGPMVIAPMNNAFVGEEVGSFDGCIYTADVSTIFFYYGPSPGISAQIYFDGLLEDSPVEAIEIISGLGEASAWITQSEFDGTLAVLRGDIVITISVTTISVNGENPRSIALDIAPLAIDRIPGP